MPRFRCRDRAKCLLAISAFYTELREHPLLSFAETNATPQWRQMSQVTLLPNCLSARFRQTNERVAEGPLGVDAVENGLRPLSTSDSADVGSYRFGGGRKFIDEATAGV